MLGTLYTCLVLPHTPSVIAVVVHFLPALPRPLSKKAMRTCTRSRTPPSGSTSGSRLDRCRPWPSPPRSCCTAPGCWWRTRTAASKAGARSNRLVRVCRVCYLGVPWAGGWGTPCTLGLRPTSSPPHHHHHHHIRAGCCKTRSYHPVPRSSTKYRPKPVVLLSQTFDAKLAPSLILPADNPLPRSVWISRRVPGTSGSSGRAGIPRPPTWSRSCCSACSSVRQLPTSYRLESCFTACVPPHMRRAIGSTS